jgi:hypothetical protein
MLYKKYLLVLVALFVLHLYAGSWVMIICWALAGFLSFSWLRGARYPLLNVLGLEILIGLLFWAFFWRRNEHLYQLSGRFHTTTLLWWLAAVAVNAITAVLCAGVGFHAAKLTRVTTK